MVDTEKIKIRELKDSDTKEVNEVVALHNDFRKDNRTVEQWLWEYKSNYPDLSIFTVLEDRGKIVGTQSMIPIYLNIKGKRILTGKSENSLLNPKYRGKSLFEKLYEYAMSLCKTKNMQCVWGYTSAVKVLSKKLGFSFFETMYHSVLILNLPNAFFEISKSKGSTGKKFRKYLSAIVGWIYSFKRSFIRNKIEYSIESKLRSIHDLDALYKNLRTKYPNLIHICQDEKYINWRIYNNPVLNYETYFIYKGNELEGYCYACKKDKTINLTDFTFQSDDAGSYLLTYLLKKWKKDAGIVVFFGNIKNPLILNVFHLFKKYGFLKIKHEDSIVLKNITYADEDHLYDVKNWYMNGLWTEGYTY